MPDIAASLNLEPLLHGLQLTVATLFIVAAVSKLRSPRTFVQLIAQYDILPRRLVVPGGIVVMLAEVCVGLTLLVAFGVVEGLIVAFALLSTFFTAVGINLRRGVQVACGCFGNADEIISARTLVRLALLLLGCAVLLFGYTTTASPLNLTALLSTGPRAYGAEVLGIAASLFLVALWVLNMKELIGLVRASARTRGGTVHNL